MTNFTFDSSLPCIAQDFYHVLIPVRDRTSETPGARTTLRVPMILPHELMAYVFVPCAFSTAFISGLKQAS